MSDGVVGAMTFRPGMCVKFENRLLRVLRALPPAAADDGAHHQRHLELAARRIGVVRHHVDQLVGRQDHEVDADMDVDRPQAADRGAEAEAGHRVLGDRRVEAALLAELLDQPLVVPKIDDQVGTPMP